MPEQPHHLIPEEFAGNEWLVDELYEQFLADKNSVDPAWWDFFEDYRPRSEAPGREGGNGAPAAADAIRELVSLPSTGAVR